jgi:DNA (cytosine-5)-methyltransferase 1
MSITYAYYNEHEPYAAAWLRNLIVAKLIASGYVDERDIQDVQVDDLQGFWQHHFFAGIGGWSHALRLAGWPDDRPVVTGSCPCQPFSVAGSKAGTKDPRHLWPEFFRLIRQQRPKHIFGEQVASPAGLAWFDDVSSDLEGAGYAVGATDLCAASVGAPHIRQRLYWVAYTECYWRGARRTGETNRTETLEPDRHCAIGGLANSTQGGLGIDGSAPRVAGHASQRDSACGVGDASGTRFSRRPREPGNDGSQHSASERTGDNAGRLANPDGSQSGDGDLQRGRRLVQLPQDPLAGFWAGAEWIPCTDGKARPVEPGTFPLAHGVSGRVGKLRAYGNAIVPQVAEAFIRAAMSLRP